MTDYVETRSGQPPGTRSTSQREPKTATRSSTSGPTMPASANDEFEHPSDFAEYRNRIGDLLLLPKSFNASYGDLPYKKKREHYLKENLLAQSLHELAYERNPGFKRFIKESGLAFRPHSEFKKADLDERHILYQKLAERIWSPERLTQKDAA